MKKYASLPGFIIVAAILSITAPPDPALSQTEVETDVLRMYFTEDDLQVVSSTRRLKPLDQVAEDISIVTAREIRAMNAHTVSEVLKRVTGVFVKHVGGITNPGTLALINIQGTKAVHALVLLDGMPWNALSGGNAVTNTIPVEIIERIEVVKGPASSAWGSSLGGVINIITKATSNTSRPEGLASICVGEKKTQDYRAELSGLAASTVGYYLFAGLQSSEGMRASRGFDAFHAYSKLDIPVTKASKARVTMGYSGPVEYSLEYYTNDFFTINESETYFLTGSYEANLTMDLEFNASFYFQKQELDQLNEALGRGFLGPKGDLFQRQIFDEEKIGAKCQLAWQHSIHTAVLGLDFEKGELAQTIYSGEYLQSAGAPATSKANPDIESWAVYLNDSIALGSWSLTPGVRYDYNSITGSFISPSFGVTYRLGKETIVRGSMSRGFTIPPLSVTSIDTAFQDANSDLDPETVWSYQVGVESLALENLWLKATIFQNDLENALTRSTNSAGKRIIINGGDIRRKGIELEVETAPFHDFSFLGGVAYVKPDVDKKKDSSETYTINIGVRYDDKDTLKGDLFGHYHWMGVDESNNGEYSDFVWDLNLSKKVYTIKTIDAELFLTVHNIFGGSQFRRYDHQNPDRWVEGGVRLTF